MKSLNKSFLNGFVWSVLGQFAYILISFIANIIISRLLTPDEFGQIAIVIFFIAFAKVFSESGLSGALIQKVDANQDDYNTVFTFNLAISIICFIILISISESVSKTYNDPSLKPLIRVLSVIIIINAFQFTQSAKIIKDLRFKRQATYAFISNFIGSSIGIALAVKGFGVWALIALQLGNSFTLTFQYWIFEKGFSSIKFKTKSFLELYKFGVNTTIANILNTVFENAYNLILGHKFSINQTGLFYQAKRLQEIPIGLIKSATLGVVFSTLAKIQNDKDQFKSFYDNLVAAFTIIVGYICIQIYSYSETIIRLLYGKEWLGSVFFMKILIISSFFYMQEMFNRVLYKVFNKTEKILKLEIIKKIIQSASIGFGIYFLSLKILLYGFLVTSIVSYLINFLVSKSVYFGFSLYELINTFKIITAGILSTLLFNFVSQYLDLNYLQKIYLFPFLSITYFILIYLFKVINNNFLYSSIRILKDK